MDRPNVLLLVMDTARAANVVTEMETVMPNLHGIAQEGTVFTNCSANAPWTLPSHASMFTGQYPSDHLAHAGTKQFDPGVPTVAERLQAAGYATVAYSNNTWVSPDFGFDRGFDDFLVRWQLLDGGEDVSAVAKAESFSERLHALRNLISVDAPITLLNFLYGLYLYATTQNDSGAKRTNQRLIKWLDKHDERPFFAFANYVEPHLNYDPPKEHRYEFLPSGMERSALDEVPQDQWGYLVGDVELDDSDFTALEALYRAELRYLDQQIGELFDYLRQSGAFERTAIFVVGDHGENIGDHGLMDHQYCLYETLLHVPLVTRLPGGTTVRNDDSLVELRDLYPTVLDIAGVDPPHSETQSENSLLSSNPAREKAIAEYLEPQPSSQALEQHVGHPVQIDQYDRALRSVRTGRWKLVEGSDGKRELYDLSSDPGEKSDCVCENPDVEQRLLDSLSERLGDLVRSPGEETKDIDADTEQRLEDLGYIQ